MIYSHWDYFPSGRCIESFFSCFHFTTLESGPWEVSFGVRRVVFTLQVVAIVTDRLTDCAVIGDLHVAASRGVAVYIILNQRSIQETFTLKKLRHPVSRLRHTSPANSKKPRVRYI